MRIVTILVIEVLNPLLVMSFALFVSLGYILTLLMPVDISHWQALLLPSTLIPLVWLSAGAYRSWKQSPHDSEHAAWRVLLPFVIPALVLAPGLYAVITSPTVQILSHPDIHFGYIYQLLNGSTPLENVFVAGYAANYYWLFHAFAAAIIETTSLRPPYILSAVNILAVFSSLLWIGQTLVALKLSKPRTLHLGLLAVFVFCSVNATGILSLLAHLANGTFEPDNLRLLVPDGGHKHLHSALNKLTNINAMDLGIAAFAASFYSFVKIVKSGIELRTLVLISACGIAGLAANQLATLYIVVALLGSLFIMAVCHWLRSAKKRETVLVSWNRLKSEIPPHFIVLYFVISLVLAIPLLKYNYDIAYNTRGDFGFELLNQYNIAVLWAAFALLLPLFVLQWVYVLRRGNNVSYFIQLSGGLGLLLGSGLLITIDNQYKGSYFLSIVLAMSSLLALQRLKNSDRLVWKRAGRIIATALFALVFSRIIYVDLFMLNKGQTSKYTGFAYDGEHIAHSVDRAGRFAAYYWIRDNTPADALVITPIDGFVFASVLPERQFYVKRAQFTYTANIQAYDRRVRQLNAFYRNDTGPEEYQYMSRNLARHFPDRPFFAVVKDSEVSPEVMKGRDADLVFEHPADGANVYRLHPKPDAPQEG